MELKHGSLLPMKGNQISEQNSNHPPSANGDRYEDIFPASVSPDVSTFVVLVFKDVGKFDMSLFALATCFILYNRKKEA